MPQFNEKSGERFLFSKKTLTKRCLGSEALHQNLPLCKWPFNLVISVAMRRCLEEKNLYRSMG